jgi:hypothetical protein
MNIYLGETGLNKTFQEDFPKTIKCHKCEKDAKIMFVAQEWDEKKGNYICDLHETTGEEGGLWLHDACSVAVYLCPFCFEATTEVNQA